MTTETGPGVLLVPPHFAATCATWAADSAPWLRSDSDVVEAVAARLCQLDRPDNVDNAWDEITTDEAATYMARAHAVLAAVEGEASGPSRPLNVAAELDKDLAQVRARTRRIAMSLLFGAFAIAAIVALVALFLLSGMDNKFAGGVVTVAAGVAVLIVVYLALTE